MTAEEIIEGILEREGPGAPPYWRPGDAGGRTAFGISERAHPEAWLDGPPSRETARAIYRAVYVAPFDSLVGRVGEPLRVALIDDAVMSGVVTVIKRLQVVLGGLTANGIKIDGILGPNTREAAAKQDQSVLLTRYTIERVIRLTRIVQRRPTDLVNLTGWVTRALLFLPHRGS